MERPVGVIDLHELAVTNMGHQLTMCAFTQTRENLFPVIKLGVSSNGICLRIYALMSWWASFCADVFDDGTPIPDNRHLQVMSPFVRSRSRRTGLA